MALTAKDVAEITRLLEESSFDELYLEIDGVKLTLRRGSSALPPAAREPEATVSAPEASALAPGASALTPETSVGARELSVGPPDTSARASDALARAPAASPAHASAAADSAVRDVPAPLLGTFYRAPKPGAPPFIDVGSLVQEETIVGIIEVMKLMNTVRAGVRGRVTEILARDGVLVEYGETLLRVGRTS